MSSGALALVGEHWHVLVSGDLRPLLGLVWVVLFGLPPVAMALRARERRARQQGPQVSPVLRAARTPVRGAPLSLRASDAERDAVAERLGRAMGEGRLDLEEGQERIDAALRARYRQELEVLVADLPREGPPERWR